MQGNDQKIEVPEYKDSGEFLLDKRDVDYLEQDTFHKGPTFELLKSKKSNDGYHIRNSSYAGIIELSDIRIIFSTKVKSNLFYLLRFITSEDCILFDPNKVIDLEEGQNFFEVIGRLFANELKNIIQIGILKKYVSKEENLNFLKGKLNIREQFKNNISSKPKFHCTYQDLTFDNKENRIVLDALIDLIGLININEDLKEELISYEYFLRNYVSYEHISPSECELISYNRLNEKYRTIISLSKIILEEKYIRSTEKGYSKGFNFIVNMNKVFEDFITEMIKQIINEKKEYSNYTVNPQLKFTSLDQQGELTIKPDIVIEDEINNTPNNYPLILDTKYKKEDVNSDYYQVISYALAIPTSKYCVLIYPIDFLSERELNVSRDLPNIQSTDTPTINIIVRGIDLHIDESIEYSDYIRLIKDQLITKVLEPCLLSN